ncbi:hypothetical protein EDB86DRAFT_2883313 [Lactarius hatsudake]|nr:hypothetical protein EDB86DRAFT_2883313 [Lactarius hatsudake]
MVVAFDETKRACLLLRLIQRRIWALPLVHWQSWLPPTVTHEPPSASGDIALDQCPFCGSKLDEPRPTRQFTSAIYSHVILCVSYYDIQSHINDCCDSSSHSTPSPGLLVPSHNPTAASRQFKCEGLADCDAYSDLMSSRKANETWKEADMDGDRSFPPNKSEWWKCIVPQGRRRRCFLLWCDPWCDVVLLNTRTFRPLYEPFVDLASRSDLSLRGHG